MRYLVFAGQVYYPHGGADDLVAVAGSKSLAIRLAKEKIGQPCASCISKYEWAHVFDLKKMEEVYDI